MDSGQGKFVEIENDDHLEDLKESYPFHGGIFKVGEVVELKTSKFRIKSIKPTELRLKLIKRGD